MIIKMSDYDEYDDQERYEDYGEEDGYDDYREADEFGVGYRQIEQANIPTEEWDVMATQIEGTGELARIQQRMVVDDETQFRIKVADFVKQDIISNLLNQNDISTINKHIRDISFINKRNPYLYVLGYYYSLKKSISKINTLIPKVQDDSVDLFGVLKYSKIWEYRLYSA
jgi:hypothetical protein